MISKSDALNPEDDENLSSTEAEEELIEIKSPSRKRNYFINIIKNQGKKKRGKNHLIHLKNKK